MGDGVWAGVAVDPPVVRWGFSMAVLRTALELNNLVVKASGRRIRWRCRSITASRFLPRNFSFFFLFCAQWRQGFCDFSEEVRCKGGGHVWSILLLLIIFVVFFKNYRSGMRRSLLEMPVPTHCWLFIIYCLFWEDFFQISEIEFFTLQLFEKMAIKCHAWWPRCPPISIHLNVDPSSM